jgi:hypothetical protein
MYHAVADQLKRHKMETAVEGGEPAYKQLRRLASEYMRKHPDDFLPFLALEEDGKSMTGTGVDCILSGCGLGPLMNSLFSL